MNNTLLMSELTRGQMATARGATIQQDAFQQLRKLRGSEPEAIDVKRRREKPDAQPRPSK